VIPHKLWHNRFFRAGLILALVAAATLPDPGRATADSLWSRRERRQAFLFEDNRGRQIGDLLTIAINETSNIGNNETNILNKTDSMAHVFGFKADSSSTATSLKGAADLSLTGSSNRTLNGQATLTDVRSYTDAITVSIIDILPNGNLVIEGHRTRFLSGEERTIRVTGIVRPTDIGAQNTVQSQFVGNFQIAYIGKGPDTDFNRWGWWGRAMNFLWPF
jgi:flagellar L-ring protein precursor FlgH